tara:strand:+ start:626 stop:937 length:312 start_codon:yes stop_codon:yes gene_type:complete
MKDNIPKPKITLKNIYSFFEGNLRMIGDKFNTLPRYKKEQIMYRVNLCKDSCLPLGKCPECGCSLPGKWYASKSCNKGKKFPDMMDKEEWVNFKFKNGLKFDL